MNPLYPESDMKMAMPSVAVFKTLLQCLLLLSLLVIISLPIFQAGYFSDDMINSLIPGTIKIYHFSFWSYVYEYMKIWINYGRFFPLSILSSILVFNYFPDAHDYQIIRLVFIWISIFSFAWLLKVLTRDVFSALLFLILTPMCWSIHDAADPLVSFAIFLPLVVIFAAMTLIFLRYYQDTEKTGWLALSLVMYLGGLACYELGMVTFFLMLIVVHMHTHTTQHKIEIIKPYAILTLAYLLTYTILQHTNHLTYDGIKIHLGMPFLSGFIVQLTSALPLSYYLLATHTHLDAYELLQHIAANKAAAAIALYLFFVTLITTFWLIRKVQFSKKNILCICLTGWTLMIFPAVLMGLSQKYQILIHAGRGYIPVYVQYLGTACLLLSGICWLNLHIRQKTFLHLAIAAMVSAVVVMSWIVNLAVVTDNNEHNYNTRALYEKALQHNVLATLPDHAYLIERLALWNAPDFYAINTDKNLAGVIDINDRKNLPADKNYQDKFYIEAFHLENTQNGFVVLGHIQALSIKKMTETMQLTEKIKIENPMVFIAAKNLTEYKQICAALSARLGLSLQQQAKLYALYSQSKNPWWLVPFANHSFDLAIRYN
jgi:hypothetical protein